MTNHDVDDARRLPRYRPESSSSTPLARPTHIDPHSPAGRRALRGIPVVGGVTGTIPGTDPLQALIDSYCACGRPKNQHHATCRTCEGTKP